MVSFFKVIDYLLTKSLTSLITISSATKKTVLNNSKLLSSSRLQGYVIHCGVPKNKFSRQNYLSLKKKEDNNLTLKIGMLSRLSNDKGHEDLIKAFSKLPIEYKKKMDIVFVGEDVENKKKEFKNLISDLKLENKIIFLDYVDLDSKKIILSFDLFLSLTRSYEGFGLSIAEAMSVGIPILATNVGAVNEFFNDSCGKLIKPRDIETIKNSLIDFCDNKKEWDNKAKIGKDRIEKYFNSEIMGNNYMNHFTKKFSETR